MRALYRHIIRIALDHSIPRRLRSQVSKMSGAPLASGAGAWTKVSEPARILCVLNEVQLQQHPKPSKNIARYRTYLDTRHFVQQSRFSPLIRPSLLHFVCCHSRKTSASISYVLVGRYYLPVRRSYLAVDACLTPSPSTSYQTEQDKTYMFTTVHKP